MLGFRGEPSTLQGGPRRDHGLCLPRLLSSPWPWLEKLPGFFPGLTVPPIEASQVEIANMMLLREQRKTLARQTTEQEESLARPSSLAFPPRGGVRRLKQHRKGRRRP